MLQPAFTHRCLRTRHLLAALLLALSFVSKVSAQTTGFTYQGKLADGGSPAAGNYDLQFKLFDLVSGGTQQGTTQTISNVVVSAGIFIVQLDFGACDSCFNGAARFLEIAVKKTTDATFVTLAPRQPITSTPYAIKTRNLTFNGPYDDGFGTPFTLSNTFTGEGAGLNTTPDPSLTSSSGKFNAFYGARAGQANTTGSINAFFGYHAGQSNTTGIGNAFFGPVAGQSNTTGAYNVFFGPQTGLFNTTGSANAFFGVQAGANNTTGNFNAFFGHQAGQSNTGGVGNSFFGTDANFLSTNTTGSYNTLLGYGTRVNASVINGTAIGAFAQVTQSNSLVLGSISGVNGAVDTRVGIGTTAPGFRLEIVDSGSAGLRVQTDTSGGTVASFGGLGDFSIDAPFIPGGRFILKENGNVGIGTSSPVDRLEVNGIIRVQTLGAAGSTALCRNGANQISSCSSSIRYKTNIGAWHSGLSLINRLRPVTFDWKQGGQHDLGLVAEEVAKVEPLLVTHNDRGEIEGVKYDRVNVALINAVKEQQQLIEQQRQQLDALKKLVCASHRKARACK